MLELALPLLEEAAGGPVEGLIGDPEPLNAVQDAVNLRGFDEIIVSTLPARVSRWLHLDLPSKLGGLGLPVTTVTAKERSADARLSARLDASHYNRRCAVGRRQGRHEQRHEGQGLCG